jgi:hypothetical protein
MSDDFGMGFACHYLAEQHGIQAFANTTYLLDSLIGVTTLRPGKRGPAKSPDFIAIDSHGRLHILECKGTQSSTDYLLSALESGIDQKNNFTNSTPFASSMVGGIFVPQHSSPEEAVLMYIDPQPDARLRQLAELPRTTIEQGIYRISLAKELMAAGLWRTASDVEGRGRRRGGAPAPGSSTIDAELPSAGFNRIDHAWSRTMQYRSIEIDPIRSESQEILKEYSRRTTLNVEVPDEVIEFGREVLSMDRGGAQEEADQLILVRAKERRQRRTVRTYAQSFENAPFRTRIRRVASAWDEQSTSPTSSTLTGPSGIKFTLSREEDI